jgi:hypothetical protein
MSVSYITYTSLVCILDSFWKNKPLTCVYIEPTVITKGTKTDILGNKNHVANPAMTQTVARSPI